MASAGRSMRGWCPPPAVRAVPVVLVVCVCTDVRWGRCGAAVLTMGACAPGACGMRRRLLGCVAVLP